MRVPLFGGNIITLILTPILSLAEAVVLRAAAKWTASMEVPFRKAYGIAFIIIPVITVIQLLLERITGYSGARYDTTYLMDIIVTLAVWFLVVTPVVCWRLLVAPPKALWISLVMLEINIGIGIILWLFFSYVQFLSHYLG